jgi:hypothetical protein
MCTVRRRLPLAAILLAALAAVAAAQTPAVREGESPDIVEHFKYGSIGTEGRVGVPYWIWRVLPIVFEDKLPNRPGEGYERLGFLFEGAPHGRPIGTTHKKDRVDVVGLNCATCHVGSPGNTIRLTERHRSGSLRASRRGLRQCAGSSGCFSRTRTWSRSSGG